MLANTFVFLLVAVTIGWLIYLAIRAGKPVQCPAFFILWTHNAFSAVRTWRATRIHLERYGGDWEGIFNIVGSSFLAFVLLFHFFM